MLAFAIPPLALVIALSFVRDRQCELGGRVHTIHDHPGGRLVDQKRSLALAMGDPRAGIGFAGRFDRRRRARLSHHGTGAGQPGGSLSAHPGMAGAGQPGRDNSPARRVPRPSWRRAAPTRRHWSIICGTSRSRRCRGRASDIPQNHFELTRALDNSAAEPVLLITYCPFIARLKRNYQDVTLINSLVVSAGPNTRRHYQAFRLASRTRDIEPLGPCVPDAAT